MRLKAVLKATPTNDILALVINPREMTKGWTKRSILA